MKKTILIIITLTICVVISIMLAYSSYTANTKNVRSFNRNFEQYQNEEFQGTQLATIINKAIDNNEQYAVGKDDKGNYIDNNETSVRVDIYIKENKTIYSMETISKLKIDQFVENFSIETFKVTKIEYHESSKRVKYMLIEQI